jgi:NAD(P)H-dependent FMN reductase
VLLAATGGSERHALVLDHQLRPLFSFFQAVTLPIGVYATEADFSDYQITSEPLKARIQLAAERARRCSAHPNQTAENRLRSCHGCFLVSADPRRRHYLGTTKAHARSPSIT